MPLPFWTVGGSQVLWGRSLLAARLTGLGLGLGALALVALIDAGRPGPIANGGPMKRSIGSHVMADQLKTMFEAARRLRRSGGAA